MLLCSEPKSIATIGLRYQAKTTLKKLTHFNRMVSIRQQSDNRDASFYSRHAKHFLSWVAHPLIDMVHLLFGEKIKDSRDAVERSVHAIVVFMRCFCA